MTKEQILEGNKLIAYFLEWKNIGMKDLELWERSTTDLGLTTDELKFNSSWDWLMPVVEKIENMQDGVDGDSIRAHSYDVTIRQHVVFIEGTDIEISEYSTKILTVFWAVIEFIKWYNLNSKSS